MVANVPTGFLYNQQIMGADHKAYRIIGRIDGKEHTLLVSIVGGDGGALMFCTEHSIAYSVNGKCVGCQNAVRE